MPFVDPARLPDAAPRRIVSLVPSWTDTLAALGLDAETVGLTRFCVHPADWKARKTIVGGTKNVRVERVLGLGPDLVIANREENVREEVEALAAEVPVWLSDAATVAGALDEIRALGRLTHRAAAADALAADIAGALKAPVRVPRRVAYLIWRDPWMAVGGDTYVHDLLAAGGFENVFADRARYPAVSPEELAATRPEAVLLSSEPFPFREAHLDEIRALVPGARAVLVDGEAFSWYGARMRAAPAEIARVHAALAA